MPQPTDNATEARPEAAALALSREDVRRLMQNPSVEAKTQMLKKVTRHYSPHKLSDSELQLAEQIFRLLVQDSALKIRATLAENLKSNPFVPKDIALKMAMDEEPVSVPILSMSEVLDDTDLVQIVRNSEEIWRYLAIAEREDVSEVVSHSLVEVNHRDVTSALLDNPSSNISDEDYQAISESAGNDKTLAYKMAARPHLPVAVVEKLSHLVSAEVAQQVRKRSEDYYGTLPESVPEDKAAIVADQRSNTLSTEMHAAEEKNTLELIKLSDSSEEIDALVQQLAMNNRLTFSLIISALCHGNLGFFEASMSRLTGAPLDNVRILISDKGQLGLRALYNKSGMPPSMFRAIRLLLASVKAAIADGLSPEHNSQFSNEVIWRMLRASKEEEVENLSYVLALLRQYSK